jgi:hybrid cluster-associated redox disulfide protein
MAKTDKKITLTKEMSITEILHKKPDSGSIMMEYGLHCLGCMAAEFESLEQGCLVHGIAKDKIEEMMKRINQLK